MEKAPGSMHMTALSNPDLPESKQAYQVIVRFFDRHLGGAS